MNEKAKTILDQSKELPRRKASPFETTRKSISIRKNLAVAELSKSNVQTWLEVATDGVWEWDFETNRQYFSPQFMRLLGYGDLDLLNHGKTWQELVHPEDHELFSDALEQHLKENEPFNISARYLHSDGNIMWVLCRGVAQKDQDNNYIRMLGTYTDITKLKFAQNSEIARSQVLSKILGGATLQEVLDTIASGVELQYYSIHCSILLLDSTKTKLMVASSPSLPDFYNTAIDGITIGPAVGSCGSAAYLGKRVVVEDIHQDERWEGFKELAKQAKLGSCWSEPIISSKEVVLGTFAIYHKTAHAPDALDIQIITESAQLAAIAIERKLDEEERNKIEAQLFQTKRLESIGALAGGIAHDFNNFLTSLFGFIEISRLHLQQGSFQKAENFLGNASASLDRAKSLTNQLLTFSRGGSPVKKFCHIGKIIKEVVTFTLSGSNVNCKINISENLWPCNVDRHQIAQVIDNIVRNSHDALCKGGRNNGEITITAENFTVTKSLPELLSAGKYVKIVISDEGPGIEPEAIEKIFEPFFSTKADGRGLGLSIAYSIVKKHAGHIDVKSKYGSGVSFDIILPASPEAKPLPEKKIDQVSPPGHGKILVMDDEESIRTLASHVLENLNYSYELADSGETAVMLYQKALKDGQPFDLVILDLTVRGGMGGEETIKILKETDPSVKALVSSGYADSPISVEPSKYGFLGAVPKPYSLANLADIIQKVIGS